MFDSLQNQNSMEILNWIFVLIQRLTQNNVRLIYTALIRFTKDLCGADDEFI
jgi:hypothetical protein